MTLFNGFYPTPKPLAEKMLEGINWNYVGSVLEPSGGKGDLAEIIKEKMIRAHTGRWNNSYIPDIDLIETNPDLQSIIKGKGYRLIHNDFLNFNTYKKYDLIVMNPPFDNGAKHLLKAIEVMEYSGGCIVCLLNAQTLKNPHTYERQELTKKLNELSASIEYKSGTFKTAERKTDVEIAIIKIFIPETEKESLIISELKKAERLKEINQENKSIIEDDYIKQAVSLYNFEVQAGLNLIKEYNKIKPYMHDSFNEGSTHEILKLTFNEHNGYEPTQNEYVQKLNKKYWSNLFANPKFTKNFTSNLLDKCRKEVDRLKEYTFSEYNITEIRAEMTKDIIKGVEDSIMDVFELLTNTYHWHPETQKNRHYYSGWRSNDCYKIGKKSILPYNIYAYITGDSWSYSRRDVEQLEDIEKSLNYINSKPNDHISIRDAIKEAEKTGQTRNILCKYFSMTAYKKGTIHLTYTDPELIQILNRKGAQGKSWLPPGYGKKEYNEMSKEEKEVINSFEGEEEYNKVIQNPEIYLPEITGMLQLGE